MDVAPETIKQIKTNKKQPLIMAAIFYYMTKEIY